MEAVSPGFVVCGGAVPGLGGLLGKLIRDGVDVNGPSAGRRALDYFARIASLRYPSELSGSPLGIDRDPIISLCRSFPTMSGQPYYQLTEPVVIELARAAASLLTSNTYKHLLEGLEREHRMSNGEVRQWKVEVFEDGSPLRTFERLEREATKPPMILKVELLANESCRPEDLDELVNDLTPQMYPEKDKFHAYCATLLESTVCNATNIVAWASEHMLKPRGIPTPSLENYSDNIAISAGSSLVMHSVVARAFVKKGQVVLMPQGTFEPIQTLYDLGGGESVMLECEHNNFKLDASALQAAITKYGRDKIGCVVITDPTNALGNYYTAEELCQLAQVAVANDILIVSDEIYSGLAFPKQGARQLPPSIAALEIERGGETVHMHDRVITIYGFSKILADRDSRIGLATCGSAAVIGKIKDGLAELGYLPTVKEFHQLEARMGYYQESVINENRARFQENFEFMEAAIQGANKRLARPMISLLSRPEEGYLACLALPADDLKPLGIEDSFSLAQYIFAAVGLRVRPIDGMGLGKAGERIAVRVNFCEPEQQDVIEAIDRLEGLSRVILDGSAPLYTWATREIEQARILAQSMGRFFISFEEDLDERN